MEYVKNLAGTPLAVIHLGADMLMRPVYRPGQWKHRFLVLDPSGKLKTGDPAPWTIAGPLCFAGDIVADATPLPPVDTGDFIAIRDVGAYTLSMWSRHCSRAMPKVIGFTAREAELRVLRHAETAEGLAEFWSLGAAREASGVKEDPVRAHDAAELY